MTDINTLLNEMICPYCGGENTRFIDGYDDSEKRKCCDCGEDYIVWYSDDGEIEAVTDRNDRKLFTAMDNG